MVSGSLHRQRTKDNCFRSASTFLRWIIEPSAIMEEKQRRRVRLLSAFLLLMAINTFIGALVIKNTGSKLWLIMLVTAVILTVGYVFKRTRYYRLATFLAVTMPTVPILAMAFFSTSHRNIPTQLPWLALPLLISSLLLSLRNIVIIAITYLAIIIILMPFVNVPTANLFQSLGFIFMIYFLVIAITEARQQDQSEIERQLTERTEAEEALRESEEKYRAIFEQASDSIVLVDIETSEILDFNDRAHENLGYSREEFAKLKIPDIDTTECDEDVKKRNAKVRKDGFDAFETKHRTKDGEIRDTLISLRTLNISGKIFSLSVWHDITERKQTEEKLRESEEFSSSLMESSAIPILVVNDDLSMRYVNPSFEKLTGFTAEEIIGKTAPYPWWLGSKDSGDVNELREDVHTGVRRLEKLFQKKTGEQFWVEITSAPVKRDGKFQCSLENWHDITERKRAEDKLHESEEKYRAIFEQATDSIVLINAETEAFVDFNDKAHQNLGYSREEFAKLKVIDFDAVQSHEDTIQHLKKTVGGETDVFETKHRTKDGDIRDILVSIKTLNLSGKIFSLAVWHDITERKQSEEKLKQALSELEHSSVQLAATNKELEAFSYSVSHDLRAPLRTIDGFSQALLEDYLDKLDEQGKDYLCRVRSASQRMGTLIDDLLKLSRLSRSEMHKESVDLSTLAKEIVAELQQTEPERHVKFAISSGLNASGDRQLLRVALENLLCNAWKFTSKRQQAKIEVGITQNGDKKAYFVRDNGAGFDMTYANKLFGAFQRLHETTEFPGTGIGLATVQRIIHRHGGSVWAEGAVGKGATFYFTLS